MIRTFFALFFAATAVHAAIERDYSIASGGRSLPRGAAVTAEGGLNQYLWSEKRPYHYQYGYLREFARVDTSGVVTRLMLGGEIYPISIFGLSAGAWGSVRGTSVHTVDCEKVACGGTLVAPFARARAIAGHGWFVMTLTSQWDFITPGIPDRPFAEEGTALIGNRGRDTLWARWGTFALRAPLATSARFFSAGLYVEFDRMLTAGSRNDFRSAFVRYEDGPWVATLGLGHYQSTTFAGGFGLFGALKWIGASSFAL